MLIYQQYWNYKENGMEILLNMRNESYRTRNNSLFILNLFALQFISLIALNRLGPFYLKIAQLLLIVVEDKWTFSPLPLLINFGFNVAMIAMFVIVQIFKSFKHRAFIIGLLGTTILNFKYVLLIPVGCININPLVSPDASILFKACSAFNMVVTFILSAIELYTNWSNRFIERDFCNRRQNSILCLFFQFGFVFSTIVFGNLVGSLFLIAVSIFRAYQVAITVEYPLIQSSTFFYSSLNIYMCVIFLMGEGKIGFLDLTGKIVVGILVCQFLANSGCLFINMFYGSSRNLYKISKPLPNSDRSQREGTESELQNKTVGNYKDVIILSRILMSRRQVLAGREDDEDCEWGIWWQKYILLLVSHRILCICEKCECRKETNKSEESKIVVEDLRKFMCKLEQDDKSLDLRIMGIYLNVQIIDKPLKAYYEIIRMRSEEVSVTNNVDLQCLLIETRECFTRIFLVNNIQNSSLPLMKILRFQQLVQSLELQLKQVLEASINFNQLFTLNSIKVTQLVNDSKKIFEIKQKIGSRLEDLVLNFPDSFLVTFFVFLFYQYLEVYRSKEKDLKNIAQDKNLRRRLFEKEDQDIFSPEYGVIYIDLVEERGKIKKLTKNVCQLYGHNFEDMISFNINQFMPQIYSKYHHKFLSNFIEMGKIKILADKKRLIFAKNKHKFIFPIYVRMKTEHLLNNEFGVTALVRKLETTSDYIIFGANGKIEEVTERIYKNVFQPSLKADVDKTRRLCLVKMIPALMDLINDINFEKNSQQVHESLFIFSNQTDMVQKFRIHREPRSHDSNYQSSTTYVSSSMQLEQTTNEMSMNGVGLGPSYYGQVFKAFLNELNIVKLKAYLINFRLTKLKTEQFSVFLLEVVSIEGVENPYLAAIQQYKKAAEKLNICQEYGSISQNFDKYKSMFDRNDVLNFMFNKNVEMETVKKYGGKKYRQGEEKGYRKKMITIMDDEDKQPEAESIPDSSQVNNFNQLNNLNQPEIIARGGSERSSITDQTQSQSKKQMLINAFNTESSRISGKLLFLINLFIVAMFSVLLVFVVESIQNVYEMFTKEESETMFINVKQVFQFRLAIEQMDQFYDLAAARGFKVGADQKAELVWINQQLNQQYTNSLLKIKKISNLVVEGKNSSRLYDSVLLYDPDLQQTIDVRLVQLLNELDFKFRSSDFQSKRRYFELNYYAIHKKLKQICLDSLSYLTAQKNSSSVKIPLIIFALYEVIVVVLALSWVPILYYVFKEQKKIIHLLSTMNIKQIKRATHKLRLLLDNMKINKVKEVNYILALLSDQKVENAIEMEKEKPMTRNIRLVEQPGSYSIKPKIVAIFIVIFLAIFSILPITLYFNVQTDKANYLETLEVMEQSSLLADKVGQLVNIYMVNVNKVYKSEPLLQFPDDLYATAESQFFNVTELISQTGTISNNLVAKNGSSSKFSDLLCLQIPCLASEKQQNVKFYEQILLIRNSLSTLGPQKMKINEGMSLSVLDKWVVESKAIGMMGWANKVYLFMYMWNNRFREKIEESLGSTERRLIILSGVLIPLYIACMVYVEYWLILKMARILKSAESVHMHFPVQILAENTYLTSYFNDKIKNNK